MLNKLGRRQQALGNNNAINAAYMGGDFRIAALFFV